MSLTNSDHIEGTTRGRHGAHYYQKNCNGHMVPCMTLYNDDIRQDDKICPNCFRTAFDKNLETCPRCGSKM